MTSMFLVLAAEYQFCMHFEEFHVCVCVGVCFNPCKERLLQ